MCLLTHLLGCDTWPNTNFEVVTVSDKITESTYLIRDRCLHDTYFSMLNFRDAFKKKKNQGVTCFPLPGHGLPDTIVEATFGTAAPWQRGQ